MKLKNSHILLIVMSIFLLVSIGSVCASDAAMDADILANESDTSVEPTVDSTPIKTSVESKDVTVNKDDSQKIQVTVKDNASQSISIKKEDLNVTENKKAIKFNYVNSSITLTDKLPAGIHSIVINFLGNANYSSSSKTIKLSVIGDKHLDASSSIDVNTTKQVVIPIKLTDSVNVYEINKANLSVVVNDAQNKSINSFELTNGKIKFAYDLNATTRNVTISYSEGNKTYTKKVALNRIYNAKITPIGTKADYALGNFTFSVVDADNINDVLKNKYISVSGNLNGTQLYWIIPNNGSYSISSSHAYKTDENGILTIANEGFYPGFMMGDYIHAPIGNYTLNLGSSGDVKASTSAAVNIEKVSINIVINPFKEYYGTSKQVIINVTNANTGEAMSGVILHLYMANTTAKDYYFQTDENGTSKVNVAGLVSGTYSLTVSNNDTKNINQKSVDGSITIVPKPVKIAVTVPKTYYYNSGSIATVKVTDKNTGKAVNGTILLVQVYTGKKSQAYLYQTNSKGVANINYAPAAVGSHKIVVSVADSRYKGSAVTKSVTVKKATATIAAPKVTTYYKGGKNLVIKLVNSKNKKPVYAAKVNVKVFISSNRYYNYNGQTGLDGKIRISLDTFKPGTYKVVVSKGESKNFTASQKTTSFVVKKAPAKLSPAKLTAKKGESKKFKVTVKNTKTKKAIGGVKVKIKVYTGKTTKTYTVKTNAKGIAQLNVKSLKVGTHKVVVTSGNKYVTAKSSTSSIKITK